MSVHRKRSRLGIKKRKEKKTAEHLRSFLLLLVAALKEWKEKKKDEKKELKICKFGRENDDWNLPKIEEKLFPQSIALDLVAFNI